MIDHWIATYDDAVGRTVTIKIGRIDNIYSNDSEEGTLVLSEKPLVITKAAIEEDDIFSPLVVQDAILEVVSDGSGASNALLGIVPHINDGQYAMYVTIRNAANAIIYQWQGYLTPDDISRGIAPNAQKISIKAVCVLTALKSKRLVDADGAALKGYRTVKEYLDIIFDSPLITATLYTMKLRLTNYNITNTSLTPSSPSLFPPFFETVQINGALFLDDNSRPITCYEALEAIARAFKCRVTVSGTTVRVREIFSFDTSGFGLSISTADTANLRLLGNTEMIRRVRSFREAVVRYRYQGQSGGVENGTLREWSGDTPVNVDLNLETNTVPYYAYSPRKRGNGRPENPFGISLRWGVTTATSGGDMMVGKVDMIAFKVDDVQRGQNMTISVQAMVEGADTNPDPYRIRYGGDAFEHTRMICDAIIYNNDNPQQSRRYKDDKWEQVDLLPYTSTFGSGHYDFSVNLRDPLLMRSGGGSNNEKSTRYQSQYGKAIQFGLISGRRQTSSVDLKPCDVSGTMYIAVSPIMNLGKVSNSTTSYHVAANWGDTVVSNVDISLNDAEANNRGTSGEVAYITRNLNPAVVSRESEIRINTGSTYKVGGLHTQYEYALPITVFDTVLVMGKGAVKDLGHETITNIEQFSLLKYNAYVMQSFNTPRQVGEIDVLISGATIPMHMHSFVWFSGLGTIAGGTLFDSSIKYAMQRMVYDVKKSQAKLVIMGLNKEERAVSSSLLNNTTDMVEEYYSA